MRLAMLIFGLMLAMFVIAAPSPTFAQTEDGCADAVDNDEDGFINDGCPAVGLPEVPAVTDEPTASPEPVASPTDAPATDAPSATPTDLPDTGGDPGDGDTTGGTPADLQFSEWLTQTGIVGIAVSFLITLLTVLGISLSSYVKRIMAFTLGVATAILFVAIKDSVSFDSVEDVTATAILVLGSSQVAYLLIDGLLQGTVNKMRGNGT